MSEKKPHVNTQLTHLGHDLEPRSVLIEHDMRRALSHHVVTIGNNDHLALLKDSVSSIGANITL
ncbi:hypothetical protein, partial [Salmonella enterica]|uniref:hypothetical protein n=1 Tax=Salmonella enterica TaxID=28901 RepID=UPI0020C4A6AD